MIKTELFRVDLQRAIEHVKAFAEAHPWILSPESPKFDAHAVPERMHDFPPYRMILTIDIFRDIKIPHMTVSMYWIGKWKKVLPPMFPEELVPVVQEAFAASFSLCAQRVYNSPRMGRGVIHVMGVTEERHAWVLRELERVYQYGMGVSK